MVVRVIRVVAGAGPFVVVIIVAIQIIVVLETVAVLFKYRSIAPADLSDTANTKHLRIRHNMVRCYYEFIQVFVFLLI